MDTASSFGEDLRPTRKRAVSISSVDSEPIRPRVHNETAPSATDNTAVNRSESSSDDGGDEGFSDGRRVGGQPGESPFPLEVQDVDASLWAGGADDSTGVTDWVSVTPPPRVSEAAVAIVSAVNPRAGTCVAEMAPGTLCMDTGTRFCLSDGRTVGVLVSLLGPVHNPVYLLSCRQTQETRSLLQGDSPIVEGTALHYDLAHQRVIFSPATQCDVARGTDASYVNDDELPENVRPDFSDDEAELRWKREYKMRKAAEKDAESVSSEDDPVQDVEWDKIEMDYEEVGAVTSPTSNGQS